MRRIKRIIRDNFDAGVKERERSDDYDILIATDAISEGFNLHRAGMIINYDIPYNPTRVIQRVGRINRVNKKVFDELYICNFFPTPTGERETNVEKIAKLKMHLINSLLGEDTRILSENENLNNYFAEQYREEKERDEYLSWDARYRKDWMAVRNNESIMREVYAIPHRARIARNFSEKGVVSFAKRDGNYIFAYGKTPETVEIVSPEIGLRLFDKVVEDEKPERTTVNFDPIYAMAKEHMFRDNTKPPIKGKRKQNALAKVSLLREKYPAAEDICRDIEKIIKDF